MKPRTELEARQEVLRRMGWPPQYDKVAERTYAFHFGLLALRWEEFLAVLPNPARWLLTRWAKWRSRP